jgi:hypothetical protein
MVEVVVSPRTEVEVVRSAAGRIVAMVQDPATFRDLVEPMPEQVRSPMGQHGAVTTATGDAAIPSLVSAALEFPAAITDEHLIPKAPYERAATGH